MKRNNKLKLVMLFIFLFIVIFYQVYTLYIVNKKIDKTISNINDINKQEYINLYYELKEELKK